MKNLTREVETVKEEKRKKKKLTNKANIQQKKLKVIVHCRKQKSEQWMPLGDWDGLSYEYEGIFWGNGNIYILIGVLVTLMYIFVKAIKSYIKDLCTSLYVSIFKS